jgi:glycosyltransferase involved in cell wall biosynthesis
MMTRSRSADRGDPFQMTVSVCIPTCNSARYLAETLESALAQTFTDFELIVSDDASRDETCEIVKRYPDSRIRLHRLDRNQGMAFNFDHALQLAQGKYVKFLCHDDLLDPTALAKQVAALEGSSELVMVTSALRYVDAAGRTLGVVSQYSEDTVLSAGEIIAANLAYGNTIGIPSAVLIRREALRRAGPFSDDFPQMMDVEMWLRLAALGSVAYLREPLCGFRIHPGAMTSEQRKLGLIRKDLVRLTEIMLGAVPPSRLARRVAWGRVSGSFLKQALAGLRHGFVKWPIVALGEAFWMDPAFAGLLLFQTLFRTGICGFVVGPGPTLKIAWGRSLRHRS